VATTSAAVAAALGYDDHEGAPAGEMLAAAARITRSVDVPVTVDAEAGYGMTAADLVAELKGMGAAGCNLEDTNHATTTLRDPAQQATWLRAVREAASDQGHPLVINARIDVFIPSAFSGSAGPTQRELVHPAAARRDGAVQPRPRIAGGRAAQPPAHQLAHHLPGSRS
jgi:2-methylisocitrate lyase-like PEP mutase family enzyme